MRIDTGDHYDWVTANWPFLRQGLLEMNQTVEKCDQVEDLEFFCRLLDIVTEKIDGVIYLARTDSGNPLGYIVAFDNTPQYKDSSVLVYAAYSIPSQQVNGKVPGAMRTLYNRVESWARARGAAKLQTYSGRTSGAAVRWFGTYGFTVSKLLLTKEL